MVDGLVQGTGQGCPGLLGGVEVLAQGTDDVGAGHCAARVAGRQGAAVGGGDEVADLLDSGVGTAAQWAAGGGLAVVDVGAQRLLEARGLPQSLVGEGQGGVDGAVEHHAPRIGGEVLGVDGSQVGAVGEAQVGQLLLAGQRPQDIEVAGGGDGVDVVEQGGGRGAGGALGDQVLEGLPGSLRPLLEGVGARGGLSGRRCGGLSSAGRLVVGGAGDGRGGTDPARVEADDVVGAEQLGSEGGTRLLGEGDPGVAGAAGVDEQGALRVAAGGRALLHGDRDGLALRVGVVEGDGDDGAAEGGVVGSLGGAVRPARAAGTRGSRCLRRRSSSNCGGSTGRGLLGGRLHTTGGTTGVPVDGLAVEGLQAGGDRARDGGRATCCRGESRPAGAQAPSDEER